MNFIKLHVATLGYNGYNELQLLHFFHSLFYSLILIALIINEFCFVAVVAVVAARICTIPGNKIFFNGKICR